MVPFGLNQQDGVASQYKIWTWDCASIRLL